MFGWILTFFSLEWSFVATCRLELDVPASSSYQEPDATQVFTFGVASSPVFRWKYCVTVHVGILFAKSSRYHCWAMNWLLLRASNVVCVMMLINSASSVHLFSGEWNVARMWANCCVMLTYSILIIGFKFTLVIEPIPINTMCAWYKTHCRTSAITYLFHHNDVEEV